MNAPAHSCAHHHPPLASGEVLQFHPLRVALPGRFVRMAPYQPADIRIEQGPCGFAVAGHYGVELFSGHQFTVRAVGRLLDFDRFEDIPAEIDSVVRFLPGTDPHDVDFVIHYEHAGQAQQLRHNVHNAPCGWVARLRTLLDRERHGKAAPCLQ